MVAGIANVVPRRVPFIPASHNGSDPHGDLVHAGGARMVSGRWRRSALPRRS